MTLQDGDQHDRLTYWTTPIAPSLVGGTTWLFTNQPSMAAVVAATTAIAHVAGGLYLSPDLDLPGAFHCKSWWRWEASGLGWVWMGYPKMAGCHRSRRSHAPILGTATRLSYLALVCTLCVPALVKYWQRTAIGVFLLVVGFEYAPWWLMAIAAIIGIESSALAHYARDGTLFNGWHTPKKKQKARSQKRKKRIRSHQK